MALKSGGGNVEKRVLDRYRPWLLSLPQVVGVGWGKKTVRGEVTDQEALVVFVERKLPLAELPRQARIPPRLAGVATDVVETGRFYLLGSYTGRYRPARPGVSLGHYRITAGTFGAVVYDRRTGEPLILSNNHILANRTNGSDGRAQIGDPVLQPGPYDGGSVDRDTLGTLYRLVPLRYMTEPASCAVARAAERSANAVLELLTRSRYRLKLLRLTNVANRVDAALARPVKEDLIEPLIMEIGRVTGTAEPTLDLRVKKCGRTTGLTTGEVRYVNVTVSVGLGHDEQAFFEDQFVTTRLSLPGDSGSLIVDEENRAVGLLFAGSDRFTVANRIANVLESLNVNF
ncbi:hypothetical protein DXX99_00815 [Ammonifex thiophilus]|uniref:Serine protease n=1 Tax=Ammonifex thiophilus TaxID=444093 RepID=A0A3D8P7Z5_9THEO|nr:hypothetical protein DXX99_00815 [Ammonifex thiophilus]